MGRNSLLSPANMAAGRVGLIADLFDLGNKSDQVSSKPPHDQL